MYNHNPITLTLSREEAQVLRDICDNIGGDPRTSRRALADQIGARLSCLGFSRSCLRDYTGNLQFKEPPPCPHCGHKNTYKAEG